MQKEKEEKPKKAVQLNGSINIRSNKKAMNVS